MAFHEEVFPIGVAYGAVGGPRFKTSIMTLASGHERRNVDWSQVRAEYDVAYGLKTQQELDEIRAFFYARRGRAHGFRFRDWQDYKLTSGVIGLTDGTTSVFQVFKRYQSGASFYDRTLQKIEATGVELRLNGTLYAEGTGASQYRIDRNTGRVTLGTALRATVGQSIAITCKFHVPCRFDTDHLNTTLEEYNVHTWGQIPILELRV